MAFEARPQKAGPSKAVVFEVRPQKAEPWPGEGGDCSVHGTGLLSELQTNRHRQNAQRREAEPLEAFPGQN